MIFMNSGQGRPDPKSERERFREERMNIVRFIKYNKSKKMTLESYWYAACYRLCLVFIKPKKLRPPWGEEGRESPQEETRANYCQAAHISQIVNRYCDKTVWESKCLVRALTAQKMLSKRNIHSTLYLGCAQKDGKMIAHAWLRCGSMYVTGGNGEGYAEVDRFYK